MKIIFSEPGSVAMGIMVVGVSNANKLTASAKKMDKRTGGALLRSIKSSSFTGKAGQSLTILSPAGTQLDRLLIVGFIHLTLII